MQLVSPAHCLAFCTFVLTWSVQGKPRGYAFVEFEEERSVKEAFDRADGRKIDGRRVLVDVERGRTVKGWKPRFVANARAGCIGIARAAALNISMQEPRRWQRQHAHY
jgi:RNA recognition motif-containing protein